MIPSLYIFLFQGLKSFIAYQLTPSVSINIYKLQWLFIKNFPQLDILPHHHLLKIDFFSLKFPPFFPLDILPSRLNIIGKIILLPLSLFPTEFSSPQPWFSLPLLTTWYSSPINFLHLYFHSSGKENIKKKSKN